MCTRYLILICPELDTKCRRFLSISLFKGILMEIPVKNQMEKNRHVHGNLDPRTRMWGECFLNLNPGISRVFGHLRTCKIWGRPPAFSLADRSRWNKKWRPPHNLLHIESFTKKTWSLQLKLAEKFIPPKPTTTTTGAFFFKKKNMCFFRTVKLPKSFSKFADFRAGNLVDMHLLNVQVLPPADLHHLGVPTCLTKSLGKVWLKHTKVLY